MPMAEHSFLYEILIGLVFMLVPIVILIGFVLVFIRFLKGLLSKEKPKALSFPNYFGYLFAGVILTYNLFFHELLVELDFLGLGTSLMVASWFIAMLIAFPKKKRGLLVYTLSLLGVAAGLAFSFRANEFTQVMNLVVLVGSGVTLAMLYSFKELTWEVKWLSHAKLAFFSGCIDQSTRMLRLPFQKKDKTQGLSRFLKTFLITGVVLFVFAQLLSAADPIFERLVAEISRTLFDRLILSFLVGFVLAGLLSFKLDEFKYKERRAWLGIYDVLIPAAASILIFGVFLFLQAKYLFTNPETIEALQINYSDYVTRGFIELLITTAIASVISYLLILKQKETNLAKEKNLLKGANVVLVLELFALLGSALQRNLLYIDAQSLSRVRLVGLIFLAWLAIYLVLLLLVNISRKQKEAWVFKGMLVASIGAFLAFNIPNLDYKVAKVGPLEEGEKVYFYVANLSEDAVFYWGEAIEYTQEYFNSLVTSRNHFFSGDEERLAELKLAMHLIYNHKQVLQEKYGDNEDANGFVWWNYSQANAAQYIKERPELFEETLNCLIDEIYNYQVYNHLNLQDQEFDRIYNYSHPLVYMPNDNEIYNGKFRPTERLDWENTRYAKYANLWDKIDQTEFNDEGYFPSICQ